LGLGFKKLYVIILFMINPEIRAKLIRNKMMKNRKYLIAKIEGSGQERDPNKILDAYFRYKNYISGDTEYEKQLLEAPLQKVWSSKFLGLNEDLSKPFDEIKKLEFQNPAYSGAYRLHNKKGDPRNYNKVFAVQASGCTFNCNYCYVPREINNANPNFGQYFSADEIVKHFLNVKQKSTESMNVIRLTGGEIPSIIPEMIIDVYNEMEKQNLDGVYLWVDTNLSITKYLEKMENDLKEMMQKNVGVVGCFKGICKEDFAKLTGTKPEFYKNQFEAAKLFLDWKTDFYVYLPALVYENNIENKLREFIERLQNVNKRLPLRTEMLIIKEYPGAKQNMEIYEKLGRPMPKTDQKTVFDLWYNKILPEIYSKKDLSKYCCEISLYE